MAGRAGRRGIDTSGLVVILPFLDFISENDAKTVMLAPPQKIVSRLSLDYSLILKLLNNKIDIKNEEDPILYLSKIFQKTLYIGNDSKLKGPIIKELEILDKKLLELEPIINSEIKNKKDIYEKLFEINNKLKPNGYFRLDNKIEKKLIKEKKELESTINLSEMKLLESWIDLEKNIKKLKLEIDFNENKLNIHLQRMLDFLKDNDMIDSIFQLTKKGRIISEINECNPLIMTKIIENNIFNDLEFPEIMAILSLFIADKDREDIFISDLDITQKEEDKIKDIIKISDQLYNEELELVQNTPFQFKSDWQMSFNMVEIIKDWSEGHDWLEIKHKFNNYEGNFIKNILRLSNLVKNIESIAVLLNNVSLINKLNGFQEKLIRNIVITDSLYI
jgi:superfamily II RNA helicase